MSSQIPPNTDPTATFQPADTLEASLSDAIRKGREAMMREQTLNLVATHTDTLETPNGNNGSILPACLVSAFTAVYQCFNSLIQWILSFCRATETREQEAHTLQMEPRRDEPAQTQAPSTPLLSETPLPAPAAPVPVVLPEPPSDFPRLGKIQGEVETQWMNGTWLETLEFPCTFFARAEYTHPRTNFAEIREHAGKQPIHHFSFSTYSTQAELREKYVTDVRRFLLGLSEKCAAADVTIHANSTIQLLRAHVHKNEDGSHNITSYESGSFGRASFVRECPSDAANQKNITHIAVQNLCDGQVFSHVKDIPWDRLQ